MTVSRWYLKKDDSPICLHHKMGTMKVMDELSFGPDSDFTREDIQNYIDRYIKHFNPKAEFMITDHHKTVKYRITRLK